MLAVAALHLSVNAQEPKAIKSDVTLTIDWSKHTGTINRGIFSTQGFMQVYTQQNPMVLETFKFTNPSGTHTRLETYIHQMEPENDNADPNVFDWEKFKPQSMIRFIEDRAAFEKVTDALGMEWLSLLCYNVDWLKSGNKDATISSNEEWGEYAAAVVESYNGNARSGKDYAPRLKYVEIWNEPNHPDFSIGTQQSYFDLFNITAQRLHRDYPGVMVGGPALATTDPNWNSDDWMINFLKACGANSDYISYHHYGGEGEPVEKIMDDLKKWVGEFRKIPGKERGRAMITEIDQWSHGWPKSRYVMERQFGFLALSDLILSIHHFCCLSYGEGGHYTFGIVDRQGGVLGGTFWPYWMFRALSGMEAYCVAQGTREGDLKAIASWDHREGQNIGSAVMFNRGTAPITAEVRMFFPATPAPRVLVLNRMARNAAVAERDFNAVQGIVESVEIISKDATQSASTITLMPGEAVTFILQETSTRFYTFKDILNQETPWVGLTPKTTTVNFLETADYDLTVRNTLPQPVSGQLSISGIPSDWKVEVISGEDEIKDLPFGQSAACTFRVTASSIAPGGWAAPFAAMTHSGQDRSDLDKLAHSIPAALRVVNPLDVVVLPQPIHAVPGETNQITIQISNKAPKRVEGAFTFAPPAGMSAADGAAKSFALDVDERGRFHFPFNVPGDYKMGQEQGSVTIHFMDSTLQKDFTVQVTERQAPASIKPFGLSPWLNFDAAAFASNHQDFDQPQMGLFTFPADFMPSNGVANIRGIPFQFASLDDGKKNAVLPQGQKIPIPQGDWQGVAFLGFGHDGKHPGIWIFHYSDGSTQSIESQIPEWCTPPPPGFQVAFRAPHRYYWHSGPATPSCELFQWTLPTAPGKNLTAVELPEMKNAYIFAMTPIPAK